MHCILDCLTNTFEPLHTLPRSLRRRHERGHESERPKTCISQSPIRKCHDSVCDSVVEIESCHCDQQVISTLMRSSDRCTDMPFHFQASCILFRSAADQYWLLWMITLLSLIEVAPNNCSQSCHATCPLLLRHMWPSIARQLPNPPS